MRRALICLCVALAAACAPAPGPEDGGTGGGSGGAGGGAGGAGGGGTGSQRRLGLNDLTVLVPLPGDAGTPVLLKATDLALDGTPLLPDGLYQRVIRRPNDSPDVFTTLAEFHVVAVRFDLCDRQAPWPCEATDDGRLRVVFQPIFTDGNARDIALHGFYEIPVAEVAGAVDALRGLAELSNVPLRTRLEVSPGLRAAPAGAYAAGLRDFVRRWANSGSLRRLTFFAQPDVFAQVRWVFRGLEGRPPNYALINIAGLSSTEQDVILEGPLGMPGYSATPFADDPAGLGLALDGQAFSAATQGEKDAALAALTAVSDPTRHTPETVQCVACHVSTFLSSQRAVAAGTTADQLPGRFSSIWPLSVDGGVSTTSERFLRALGWFGKEPLISQRVVNETAQTAAEVQQRFPVP